MQLLIFILSFLTLSDHPIHLTVMELYENEDRQEVELSVTLFMDDFADAVHYDKYKADINAGKMTVDDLILKYLNEKTSLRLNGKKVKYSIREKETNFPALTCYLQLNPLPKDINSLEIESTLFLEMFDDQKNMVHIRIPDKREGSMILNKRKTSGETKL